MKFFITLTSVSALFASGISASVLGERGKTAAEPVPDYAIDTVIAKWMEIPHVLDMLGDSCSSTGGWEGWVQRELEYQFKKKFELEANIAIREKTNVFENLMKADFVLPKTTKNKGMIIELKCENTISNKGHAMKGKVAGDKGKAYHIRREYEDHTFVVLALAYTEDAEKALTSIGLWPIPKAEHEVPGKGTMKVYERRISLPTPQKVTDLMEDMTESFTNLFS